MAESFTCPRCGRTSHNPNDIAEGYCGYCHDWTGDDWVNPVTGHESGAMSSQLYALEAGA